MALSSAAARRFHRRQAVRILRRFHRRMASERRALHQRAGNQLPVVAVAYARRTHQPLGTHLPAHGSLRLQAVYPRRPGLRLAVQLRRPRAVLRQSGGNDRRVWIDGKHRERARRQVSSPSQTSLHRVVHSTRLPQVKHSLRVVAAFDYHQVHQWPPVMPLLRTVRPRVRGGREFLVAHGADSARDAHRQPGTDHRCDVPRSPHR